MDHTHRMEVGHTEPCERRVRAYRKGNLVVDTVEARYVWERPYFPIWHVPVGAVRREHLAPGGVTDTTEEQSGRAGYCRIDWNAVDAWFEEDQEVFGHPNDPYHRVDVRESSRRVRVFVDGELIADSTHPALLFETGLPTRYYLPKIDVRMDLLRPTTTSTVCPYKGTAEYWTIECNGRTYPDHAWGYRHPIPEAQKIAGLVCFYNEKLTIEVDGTVLPRAVTQFS